eukprot:TRINITY_DN5508_c0_g1_i3.p1 TRINITY_DN5508_c0_g1~~TRINITY_DN5508_c0_g1_i3.p1  ORF type:complete len:847 (-),score=248.69 TRINITY_DN5508_c0_g1_i3:188-2728(-)
MANNMKGPGGEKKDDDEGYIPFQGIDKGVVLQEKRLFNETPLNPKKCCALMTKLLYLVVQGEKFTKTEATDVFFAITRLFQSKDMLLRRMLFLVLKELTPFAEDVIIVMSSLTKDMNSKTDYYRSNAIRVLYGITDSGLLGQVERYLKQAIVDKDPAVASAALVAGTHLMKKSPEIVKRWAPEIQEAVNSKSNMVQYHALGLLYEIKQHDRLAVSKLVTSMIKSSVRSPYAHCLLIRYTSQVIEEETGASAASFYTYLETCLRHKSDMVIYEAARAICSLKGVTARELTPAITVLQLFLSSPKAALRFAAVRTLNKVAQTHPLSVTTCNLDMENLITDSNRSVATLAITTLLKTGNESSIDSLMKQISSFMGDISDEFKIVVVDAIRTLCVKFPAKHRTLMNFLSNILRDEGGFEYKKAIVDSLLTVIREIPESKELGLTHLCEFIEDCEFTYLAIKILSYLGNEGPSTATPSRYIRYIYNRISLENASVRAAAVSALYKFGVKLEPLREAIVVLLRRCLHDNDDEVRDRATFSLALLTKGRDRAARYIQDFPVPVINLERALHEYQRNPADKPFDISHVPVAVQPGRRGEDNKQTPAAGRASKPAAGKPEPSSAGGSDAGTKDVYATLFASMPQFAHLGPIWHSSAPVELTESELEYVVNCVKHVFDEHIVFQFNCTNTIQDSLLADVIVKLDLSAVKEVRLESTIPAPALQDNVPGSTFVCVRKPAGSFPIGTLPATLKFIVKDVDPQTGEADEPGVEDSYTLEDVELNTSDYMQKTFTTNFQERWDETGEDFEVVETYALSTMKGLQEAVDQIIKFLGMQPCDRSNEVPAKRNKHILVSCCVA